MIAHIKTVMSETDFTKIDLLSANLTQNFFSGKALYEVIRGHEDGS